MKKRLKKKRMMDAARSTFSRLFCRMSPSFTIQNPKYHRYIVEGKDVLNAIFTLTFNIKEIPAMKFVVDLTSDGLSAFAEYNIRIDKFKPGSTSFEFKNIDLFIEGLYNLKNDYKKECVKALYLKDGGVLTQELIDEKFKEFEKETVEFQQVVNEEYHKPLKYFKEDVFKVSPIISEIATYDNCFYIFSEGELPKIDVVDEIHCKIYNDLRAIQNSINDGRQVCYFADGYDYPYMPLPVKNKKEKRKIRRFMRPNDM